MSSNIRFTAADSGLLATYPQKVPFKDEYLVDGDKARFKDLRTRLKVLMEDLATDAPTQAKLVAFASLYSQNGRTQRDLWACAFPVAAQNKSYALQVALIVSSEGAEITACLGAGESTVQDAQKLDRLRREFTRLRRRLGEVPAELVTRVAAAVPEGYSYRRSWRQSPSPTQDFQDLSEWLEFAASPEGAGAAISRNLTAAELETLGDDILGELRTLVVAVTPLFDYCYGTGDGAGHLEFSLEDELADELDDEPENLVVTTATFDVPSLRAAAVDRGLLLDDAVYRAIVAAISAGKHLLLTGPPGTAKTTLAEVVAGLAARSGMATGFIPTTATADWTTYEVLGGLRPANQQSLEFQAGLVLRALEQEKWLLIDELNRANFDRAFGQLFTVLSGQSATLPYDDPGTQKPIALVPEGSMRAASRDEVHIIRVPASWRIIGTMNVFDKSLLFEMSFALMRRFAFVEVASPDDDHFKTLWRRELLHLDAADVTSIDTVLEELLKVRTLKDIGPATYIDMARFARHYTTGGTWVRQELAFQLFYSFLMPQFEGIDRQGGGALFKQLKPQVGPSRQERLRVTLNTVLGLALAPPRTDEDVEMDDAPRLGETDVSLTNG